MSNQKHQIKTLQLLIKSGLQSNIELAIQLANHSKIDIETLIAPWTPLIEILELNLEHDSLSELLVHLINSKSLYLALPKGAPVPKSIIHLPFVEELDLACNDLTTIPEEICEMTQLISLELHENSLNYLPKNIHLLTNLKFLYLMNNPIFSTELERIKTLLPNVSIKLY
ncbi:MAG: hypothetical protein GY810_22070 [Aureispira sp.]|nr:hypothetical protein [Aureispira sp.]